ncbi:MAG: hypothetical protein HZA89_08890 [Verrucomicrobia bacterium]|nr:hypothetical protein [Verrucomicrobiota bacterium]
MNYVVGGSGLAGHEVLALGALRAGADCAKCHQCEQGKLLGAFAYTLRPIETPDVFKTNAPPALSSVTLSSITKGFIHP